MARSTLYDIAAKPQEGIRLSRDELMSRLQDLLHQRLHLVVHRETRNAHAYALIIAKAGPHLLPTKGNHFPGFRINVSPGQMRGLNWSLPILAKYLSSVADFPVVDKTNLSGSYDFDFRYAPGPGAESTLPSLEVALKKQQGFR